MSAAGTDGARVDSHGMARYAHKVVSRAFMRALIRPLATWAPMDAPREGYTIIIGCNQKLLPMLWANLRMLGKLDLAGCDALVLGVDLPRRDLPAGFEERVRREVPGPEVRVACYTPAQMRVTRWIDWGWVYAWLNWCLGIAATRTRYAFLHDFDALLLRPDAIRRRYDLIREKGVDYLGVAYYEGLGISPQDRLVNTFELMFDAAMVRRRHRPIELFNTMARYKGRRVEFDSVLYAQSRAGTTLAEKMVENELVHPSQMITQFVDFVAGRGRTPGKNNLLMIPYYQALGDDWAMLEDLVRQMEGGARTLTLWGRPLDAGALPGPFAQWMWEQGIRLERHVSGREREIVRRYFDGIVRIVGVRAPEEALA